MKNIYFYTNEKQESLKLKDVLDVSFRKKGCQIVKNHEDADLLVSIGGDGTLLHLLLEYDYPTTPIVGVNTGHLGFFQEFKADEAERLVNLCISEKFNIQHHSLLKTSVYKEGKLLGQHFSLNDVAIRNNITRLSHFKVSIGDTAIERFSGDGLIVSTPIGSTAYNYSVGGSLVDYRLKLLQVSPIAPMNNKAYRSFTSSLILPPDLEVVVRPDEEFMGPAIVFMDGFEYNYDDYSEIRIGFSDKEVKVVRTEDFDFWSTVKTKFLND